MKQLRCIDSGQCEWVTTGGLYCVESEDDNGYIILDDYDEEGWVTKNSLSLDPTVHYRPAKFELVEDSPAISDEYEEEEWKRLEANTKVCEDLAVEEACCDVAFAFQLSRIQEYLRSSGANLELVVHKDFIAINDEDCKEYRGNVEQIMKFIKAAGEMTRARGELERRD